MQSSSHRVGGGRGRGEGGVTDPHFQVGICANINCQITQPQLITTIITEGPNHHVTQGQRSYIRFQEVLSTSSPTPGYLYKLTALTEVCRPQQSRELAKTSASTLALLKYLVVHLK